ncbi:YwgA family protein [Alkalicoccus chagannorensis]|uniref:YwgA family protein n=1 Tax=Alkalicoccus chagannorensis TaxID=427072 RepID=UPI00041BC5CA|nr:hypothetical protein [Alkalicoccus chagannorensis]
MLQEHAKLLAMMQHTGEIVGRKKLQKLVYIAKQMNQPFREKYQFHMYGPYSEELTLQVEEMCQAQFVSEEREKKSGYYQYRYSLTEQGKTFVDAVLPESTALDSALLAELNEASSKFLELVSTILYFEHLPRDEVRAKVYKVKARQNYSDEDMDEAFDYIDRLRRQ